MVEQGLVKFVSTSFWVCKGTLCEANKISCPQLSYFTLNISKYTIGDLEDRRVSIHNYLIGGRFTQVLGWMIKFINCINQYIWKKNYADFYFCSYLRVGVKVGVARGWWNDAALRTHLRNLENGHIRHSGVDMLMYPLTVVSNDSRLTYPWTAVSNSGRRRLLRNTTFRDY